MYQVRRSVAGDRETPFHVPSDPVFAARPDLDDPFVDTRFREPSYVPQGWTADPHRTDRGVVAVFDVRLLTKGYGEMFLQSLPGPTVRRGPLAQLPQAAERWLRHPQ
jgi:hypothetical protein